jgi:cobalamin transport system substrate-binding protein
MYFKRWLWFLILFSFLLTGSVYLKKIAPVEKVISLAPNITELIYLLGAEDKLVGISSDCNYPPEVKTKENIGPFGYPNLEKILELNPDIVLYTEVKDLKFEKKLKIFRITAVQIEIKNFADLQHKTLQLGRLLNRPKKAQLLVAGWAAKLRNYYQTAKSRDRIRVYFEIWPKPLITAGKKSFLNELIEFAGGQNIAEELQKAYPKPTLEYIIDKDPELIILGHDNSVHIQKMPVWQQVTAVKNGNILENIDQDIFLRPGPRLFEGLEYLKNKIDSIREQQEKKG